MALRMSLGFPVQFKRSRNSYLRNFILHHYYLVKHALPRSYAILLCETFEELKLNSDRFVKNGNAKTCSVPCSNSFGS
ncbi:hypothetical protein ANTPLA_LOCUS3867 [Anthophora plagiata]